ncbi:MULTISPECIES: acyltransferase family protein [unclassified Janthinobacterium]|uniref:acyltransferase family protein n=1 Tax=unclassified Janthinobacterium TaxID=2610881 RepID=UPI00047645D8|nr:MULTISPECIES: acyltransferase [unclassified Janthinobacterium]MEC5163362.1 peptidoglycan/LPS O-acetylase OafA/YrhL [Janthinobacterium sp. CG_S6]
MSSSAVGRRPELDFLRGVAIIFVMFFHFRVADDAHPLLEALVYPLQAFGGAGVDMFFTLSGFLVGGLLFSEWKKTGAINATRFLVRRAFKIWPLYYVLIFFHLLVGRHPADTFFWQNLTHTQNYTGSAILQTWSLAVEEHFYLVAAFLMSLAAPRLSLRPLIATSLLLCALVLAARSAYVHTGDLDGAFRYTHLRIDSMIYGVMLAALYWLAPGHFARLAAHRGWLIAAALALLAWLALVGTSSPLARSIGYTVEALGFCCVVVLALGTPAGISGNLLFRGVAWIGMYSYGIYLWHSLALAPGQYLIDHLEAREVDASVVFVFTLAFQALLAVGLGYCATRLVEWPFLRLRDRFFPKAEEAAGKGRAEPLVVAK